MSQDERTPMSFLFRGTIWLARAVIGLFFVALFDAMVGKWAEVNHWDNFLIQISGPPLSTFFRFLTSQHWFWFVSGIAVGVILGIWATRFLAKPRPTERQLPHLPIGRSPQQVCRLITKALMARTRSKLKAMSSFAQRVRNIGSETSKNARVFLTSLKEVHQSGVTTPTSLHDATPLPWAGWDFEPRDLPPSPEANHYVDLMRVSKHEPGWIICAQQVFADQAKLRRYRGTYRFHVTLTADNAEPATCAVDVNYLGDWHNLRAVAAPTPGKT
jgi:hypothetical protein